MRKNSLAKAGILVASCFFAMPLICCGVDIKQVEFNKDGSKDIMLENKYLRLVISEKGGKIISLYDKMNDRENSKVFYSKGGINLLRLDGLFDKVGNPMDTGTHDLTVEKDWNSPEKVKVSASIDVKVKNDEKIVPIKIIKSYTLWENSTRIETEITIINKSTEEFSLMPWIKHLLFRGKAELAKVSFMTEHGAYYSDNIIPGRGGKKHTSTNLHYYPASNWISRTVMPADRNSDTLSTVTCPSDIFKIYTWQKESEEFMTQEVIFSPMPIKGGAKSTLKYYITVTAPMTHIEYASPFLNISANPHPTGIDPETKELTLSVASTLEIPLLAVKGEIINLKNNKTVDTFNLVFKDMSPACVKSMLLPLKLENNTEYQLVLKLFKDGKAFNPGADVNDKPEIIIPLVTGTQDTQAIVFKDRTNRDNLFKKITPKTVVAPLVLDSPYFSIYRFSPNERCFKEYSFEKKKTCELSLKASANEYESVQIVLVPRGDEPLQCEIKALPFSGESGKVPVCESINKFVYAETKLPSMYSSEYCIGEYPEALMPENSFRVENVMNFPVFITYYIPAGVPPGKYTGGIELKVNGNSFSIPVAIDIWNINMPQTPFFEISADIKEIPSVLVSDASGKQMTTKGIYVKLVDMYLKYKITPTKLCTEELFHLDFTEFEEKIKQYIDKGITKIYLGKASDIIKKLGIEKIKKIEAFLEEKKLTKYFYVRLGFDEASEDKIPEIKKRCEEWKKISNIPIMETYYYDNAEPLYGLVDIYTRMFSNAPWIKERMKKGDKFWRVNAMPMMLEPEPWNGRLLYWSFYKYNFTGTYLWTVKNWVDILDWGKDWWSDNGAANLASTLIWHDPKGILSTIRLEALRNGIEDNTLLTMLLTKVKSLECSKNMDPKLKTVLNNAIIFLKKTETPENIKSAEELEKMRDTAGDILSELNTLSEK